ncbi:hypothetical protein M885DRAFT_323309 [Pelagophyceae sp. CCMP2097]|nr:hypothetical protein M885DRAFT_323309 [Pelagophyceae sp. CCMP2097]
MTNASGARAAGSGRTTLHRARGTFARGAVRIRAATFRPRGRGVRSSGAVARGGPVAPGVPTAANAEDDGSRSTDHLGHCRPVQRSSPGGSRRRAAPGSARGAGWPRAACRGAKVAGSLAAAPPSVNPPARGAHRTVQYRLVAVLRRAASLDHVTFARISRPVLGDARQKSRRESAQGGCPCFDARGPRSGKPAA